MRRTRAERAAKQCESRSRQGLTAAQGGAPAAYPKLAAKTFERLAVTRVWCVQEGSLLLHRADDGARRFAGIHELPTALQLGLDEKLVAAGRLLARKKRGITRFQITESIHDLVTTIPGDRAGLVWIRLEALDSITLSGPHRRWVTELLRAAR